jgi:hypothetical protein
MNAKFQIKFRVPAHSAAQLSRGTVAFMAVAAIILLTLSPSARAVSPAPDGGYPGNNTAEGTDALFSLTTGTDNTALGFDALYHEVSGSDNTATGSQALFNNTNFYNTATGSHALYSNTDGSGNTAVGYYALFSNTTPENNTATGAFALYSNTGGGNNTADGGYALYSNTIGTSNTAIGTNALTANTDGSFNTAVGSIALEDNTGEMNTAVGVAAMTINTTGSNNTAIGIDALYANTGGVSNTAVGSSALDSNMTGSLNIGVGYLAGNNLTTGSNNIDIGNQGVDGESNVIRLGTKGTQRKTFIAGIYNATTTGGIAVYINSSGQLGTVTSSARFKDKIHDMGDASNVLLSLRPVAFQYKTEIDPQKIPQFGLVAEEVKKVAPDLVVPDSDGKPYTVRYDAVNAMLLNEFLKEHRRVEEQGKTIAELRSTITQQARATEALAAQVKEQSTQIQRVSAELAASRSAARVVNNP